MLYKILVVNASESDRLFIENSLSDYIVIASPDFRDAMSRIEQDPDIALVIIDLSLSGTDGPEFLRTLNSSRGNLRVVLLTDQAGHETESNEMHMKAVDYLQKPMNRAVLRARVELNLEVLKQHNHIKELREQCFILDTIFQQAPIGIAISFGNETFSDNNNGLIANRMFEYITGRTSEEIQKLGWAKITHPDDVQGDLDKFNKLIAGEINGYSMEKRYIKPDGSAVWVHMVIAPITLSNNFKFNNICLIQDITARKGTEEALRESERSKSVLLSHLPGLAYRCNYDRDWTMQYVSAGCYALTGYAPECLLYNRDLSYNDLIAPEYRESLWNEWKRILSAKLPFRYEYEIITAQGERKWVLELGEGIYGKDGNVEALEGIVLDITDRKRIENNLRYNSEHDTWTGLYNRRYLENLLIEDAKKPATEKRALVAINLSAVHLLSKTYGFHYSQDLIKKVANALKEHCNPNRMLYNTYENRFVYYIKGYKDKNELAEFCCVVSKTLEAILAIERTGGGIGIIEIDEYNKDDVEHLLKNLLIVSEKAVNAFENDFSYRFFDADMEAQIHREEEINHELSKIASGEEKDSLFLQYQPILNLSTNLICGFEALARIRSKELGLIPPLDFIPLAEKTKLIIPLGEIIIFKALQFLRTLNLSGYNSISVSVNISAIQLLRNGFIDNLFEVINNLQVDPSNICLEITESIFASNYQEINRILGKLKDSGIKIAIDDFGTGYSSLARERELNINCLKIDKAFTDKLMSINAEEALTADIISMAHKLGHCVVAEGIEHEKQMQYLKEHNCDKIQGYLISKPLDEKDAIELLKKSVPI